MLHLDPNELQDTYRSAILSAELLRQTGEVARAARVESLARILERRLALAAAAPDPSSSAETASPGRIQEQTRPRRQR